ncbi:epoxide hydrolase family protein [Nocardioides humi]|uniref:Epoxide hydrolase n=1 Tax=Nocardioides humi TaxID=449461 RepID=A0ABN2A449_9ACTN|nr:epoxide hydrolase family protein [Nocardioides humi]
MTTRPGGIRDFVLRVGDDALEDVADRIRRFRRPTGCHGDSWAHGTSTDYLDELVEHWRTTYDWRAAEERINQLPQFVLDSSAGPLHFVHLRSGRPDAIPLILSHGWPWTFLDYSRLLETLSAAGPDEQAFDLVVPSLPGFCLSAAAAGPNWWETADLWVELMDALGYDRFGAVGGDWGAWVTAQLGHRHPHRLLGIHLFDAARLEVWGTARPWDLFEPARAALDPEELATFLEFERKAASHVTVHVLDPLTLSHALTDSPAGLCSWLVERRHAWTDCGGDLETVYTKDDLITTTMLYWLTDSVASSLCFYPAATERPWRPEPGTGTRVITAPTALSTFAHHARRPGPWVEEYYDLRWRAAHERGGHFSPWERPAQVAADLRASFAIFTGR